MTLFDLKHRHKKATALLRLSRAYGLSRETINGQEAYCIMLANDIKEYERVAA